VVGCGPAGVWAIRRGPYPMCTTSIRPPRRSMRR